jgi:hypothetical protein
MPVKTLIIFSFLILGSIQASAIDRNNMECMIFPTWYSLNADGSVTQTAIDDMKEFKKVEVALVPDSNLSTLKVGQLDTPIGDSNQYQLRISSSLNVNVDNPNKDHIINKAYLFKKDNEGKFTIPVSKDKQESSAEDPSNDGLSLIATQSVLRNKEFDEAMQTCGIDWSKEILPDLTDDQYKYMVKTIPLAPKTLAYIRVNCATVRLKSKSK